MSTARGCTPNDFEILWNDDVFRPAVHVRMIAGLRLPGTMLWIALQTPHRRQQLLSGREQLPPTRLLDDFRKRPKASRNDRRPLAKRFDQDDAKGLEALGRHHQGDRVLIVVAQPVRRDAPEKLDVRHPVGQRAQLLAVRTITGNEQVSIREVPKDGDDIVERLDAVIAMSQFSRDKHREFGLAREMEVLPYFLPDPDSAGPPVAQGPSPHPRPYFLFVGRLERIKGLDDVIPVFRDFPDADLLIAGDGTHGDALRQLAHGMPNVKFLGRVAPDDLRHYYQHAIALVVPSECFETFGIVLIESFRQGTPVIARRLGPFPEIIEQSGGGELFSSREELLMAMRRLQGDAGYRNKLSQSGYRAYVRRWSEHVVVPQYLDIVRRAAARRGHARVVDALATLEVA